MVTMRKENHKMMIGLLESDNKFIGEGTWTISVKFQS